MAITIVSWFVVTISYIQPVFGQNDESVIIDVSVGFGGLIAVGCMGFFMRKIIENKRSKQGEQNNHKLVMLKQFENPHESVKIDYNEYPIDDEKVGILG